MAIKVFLKSIVYTLRRWCVPWRSKSRAMILAYHSVSYGPDPYAVTPEEFEWQLDELYRQGCRIIRLSELGEMLAAGVIPPRTVVLTFDDGRKDNYVNLFPILKRRSIPVTIFIATAYSGGSFPSSTGPIPALSEDDIREMHSSGLVDFQPHTHTHAVLTKLSLDAVQKEIQWSKSVLEQLLSKECVYFAYPKGRFDEDIQRCAQSCGIRLALATHGGAATSQSDPLALPRNGIDAQTRRADFRGILAHGRF